MTGRSALLRRVRAPVLLLLAAGVAGCESRSGGEGADAADAPSVIGARTAVAAARPFTEVVEAVGTVRTRAGHAATLGAPAPTRVARVRVAPGDHVTAGQVLVELEETTFRAAAQSADAALEAARQGYERQQRLVREGIAPRKEEEQAAADLARARADAVAAHRQAQLAVLRAPIAGVVTRVAAAIGAPVDANQPLVELADPSALDIVLDLAPAAAARVHTGARVALVAGQGAAGEPIGMGRVVDVAGAVDSLTRSVAVRVRPAATRRPLRIGETVLGRITVATHPDAITVPQEALVPEGEGFKLFVVDARGVAHARPVVVGGRTADTAEIVRGLAAGERVVTYGAYGVEDGARVAPDPARPPAAGAEP
ncbi:MAG TPA: efflux RND transporter periplasmic adaptor subunit [Gemmatimonadaceae bacterium]|nr:efflux RND transporter periplasmic adaptor subunit [Gemmatimonadaceae bacterium]